MSALIYRLDFKFCRKQKYFWKKLRIFYFLIIRQFLFASTKYKFHITFLKYENLILNIIKKTYF